jgi:hypothetical protein
MSLHPVLRLAAVVLALATAGCYDRNRLVAPDDVLAIDASPATIPANGFSVSKITVRVAPTTRRVKEVPQASGLSAFASNRESAAESDRIGPLRRDDDRRSERAYLP